MKIYVYVAAIIPWSSFPTIYFFMERSVFEIILKTWSNTEIPPKPSKKAHNIIFIEIFFVAIDAISDTPFVSSIIPDIIGLANLIGILSNFKMGYKMYDIASNILLLFNIDIATENITTKPPIIIIVLLDSNIASERIAPKSFKVHVWAFLLIEMPVELFLEVCLILEYNPNIKPTEIADKICVQNNKIPIEEFENIVIPHSSNNKQWTRVICKA